MTELFDHVSPQDLRFCFLSALKHVCRKQITDLIGADAVESYLAFAGDSISSLRPSCWHVIIKEARRSHRALRFQGS
ncbi:hypothetical protein [Rhizobium sp. P28RR-XV]|uniref:hypothetical protein n=1 Tax=Rhizobium sp. P28RR-XV TaxID=2726737 RepID=UPI0014564917|nr:hypothetical protein [Rhizobium sp. P28RR-XV]NLR86125.1 hypothetical protein [Rhizobium sp. P28RR-XV]